MLFIGSRLDAVFDNALRNTQTFDLECRNDTSQDKMTHPLSRKVVITKHQSKNVLSHVSHELRAATDEGEPTQEVVPIRLSTDLEV